MSDLGLINAYRQAGIKGTSARASRPRSGMSPMESQDKFVSAVLDAMRELKADLSVGEGTYEMANVRPDRSGLPFIVYISEKGNARHAARVKIATGARPTEFVASVSIEPDVEVMAGKMSRPDLTLLRRWISLNKSTLLGYWNGEIAYTEDALAALKSVAEEK